MAWLTVDKILMQAQNLMSKFLALQILDETIKVSVNSVNILSVPLASAS